jgi:hypothetical protein
MKSISLAVALALMWLAFWWAGEHTDLSARLQPYWKVIKVLR